MTAKRGDNLGDNLRKVGRPLKIEHAACSAGIGRNATAPERRSRKSFISLMQACRDESWPSPWAARFAALTAARKWQVRGRERPHPPIAIVAPRPLYGVAHALPSLSRVAAAASGVGAGSVANSWRELHRFVPQNRVQIGDRISQQRRRDVQRHAYDDSSFDPERMRAEVNQCALGWEPAITYSIVERHVRASSLGASRRPGPGCGLDPRTSRSGLAIT